MKNIAKSLLITIVFILGVSLVAPSTGVSAASTYSCGTYGAGNYSQGGGSCNPVSAPNTGHDVVQQLTRPDTLVPIIVSILAIITGVVLVVRKKRSA